MATICSEQNRSVIDAHPDKVNSFNPRSVSPWLWIAAYSRRFLQWVERRAEQRESRNAFAHLLKLDDTQLQDIGVSRAEVERAARLPLAEDAAQVLYEATGRNRDNRD